MNQKEIEREAGRRRRQRNNNNNWKKWNKSEKIKDEGGVKGGVKGGGGGRGKYQKFNTNDKFGKKEGIDICIRSRENFILSRPIHQWNRENVKKMEKKWEEEEEGEGPKGGGWG